MTTGDPDGGERLASHDTVQEGLAVVLLSGGLDSATCLAIARDAGYGCVALSFNYGQRHQAELSCAADVAAAAGVQNVVVGIDLTTFGGSALTGGFAVPKRDSLDDAGSGDSPGAAGSGTPVTYVPARNTIFLSFALAFAEVRGAFDIFIGVNALDYSGYPDCRPEYIAAFEKMANLATRAAVEGQDRLKIHAPLIHMTKAEIIRRGLALGVDYSLTSSCYDPPGNRIACGRCDACLLRLRGFNQAGLPDPIDYEVPDPAGAPAARTERQSQGTWRGGGHP